MGLLDDAIREHLELKRLRGADPGEVIREEHEALGPVVYGGEQAPEAPDAEWDDEADDFEPEPTGDAAGVTDDNPFDQLLPDNNDDDANEDDEEDEEDEEDGPRPAASDDPVTRLAVEQETAEVDMQAMLDLDSGEEGADALEFDNEDELGWDEPTDSEQRD